MDNTIDAETIYTIYILTDNKSVFFLALRHNYLSSVTVALTDAEYYWHSDVHQMFIIKVYHDDLGRSKCNKNGKTTRSTSLIVVKD